MTIHTRNAHTAEKPYKCDQCAHSFGSPSELQSHKISHTEEKTFLGNDCNKTSQLENLTRYDPYIAQKKN